MISLKDYAKNKNVSYEAIRKQVNRYSAELEGHITKEGKTQLLDDEAVAFLDEKRKSNPVVVYEASKDEEIERLKMENKNLLIKLAEVNEKLTIKQERIELLQADKIALLEEKNDKKEQNEELKEAVDDLKDTVKRLQEELELEKNKTFWQRLFKG